MAQFWKTVSKNTVFMNKARGLSLRHFGGMLMVTKYQMISYLAEDTAKEIAKNGQEWTRYLTTAARLYKYPFNEQILIFAQRPDATVLCVP